MENISPKNNMDFATTGVVMAFDVAAEARDLSDNEVPVDLNPGSTTMALTEADAVRSRRLEFKRDGGRWTINGNTWDDVVNSGYQKVLANPGFDDVEIWELSNPHGGWFHPVHIHLVDFRVLDRNGRAPFDYEQGPKDVVYVGENETVRVIARFEHQQGRYMTHCHNLVHEDHDMMGQFLVGTDAPSYDPIEAAPAQDKPARPVCDRLDEPVAAAGAAGPAGPTASGIRRCAPKKRKIVGKKKRPVVKRKGKPAAATCAPAKRKPVARRRRRRRRR
jgi:hypothetical protein